MADAIFKIVLLLLLLAWSGYFVYRLATGVADAWRDGRFIVHGRPKPVARMVRSSSRPIEFWFTMAPWHAMLLIFVAVFALAIYGIWHVLGSH